MGEYLPEKVLWEGSPIVDNEGLKNFVYIVSIVASLVFLAVILIWFPKAWWALFILLLEFPFLYFSFSMWDKYAESHVYRITNKAVYSYMDDQLVKSIPIGDITHVETWESDPKISHILIGGPKWEKPSFFEVAIVSKNPDRYRDRLGEKGIIFYRVENFENVVEILEKARRDYREPLGTESMAHF